MKKIFTGILISLLIASEVVGEGNATKAEVAYTAKSKALLMKNFKKGRVAIIQIDDKRIILENRRGSAVITWEYYQYIWVEGFWKLSWLYLSKEQLRVNRNIGKNVVFSKANGIEVPLPMID